ncbi:MAG: c-type cytochrome [Pseudomonadota bacterium]
MSSCPDSGRAGGGRLGGRGGRGGRGAATLLARGVAGAALVLAAGAALAQAAAFPGIGRAATPKEIAAWDIDVRPDFKGLPKGSGSVARGLEVWEAQCASCHGVFGESNEVFSPIVGGTTKQDMQTGRAARLADPGFPQRTTLMKLSTVSTLWDYIHRAMPWNQPKTLSVDDVYAVTAYILNLGGIVADDFVLSDANIADVQRILPNRNGKTLAHAMWPGAPMGPGMTRTPDVKAVACMTNCPAETTVASFIPDHARNAHGNLAEQNRLVGPQRGADTTRPPPAAGAVRVAATTAANTAAAPGAAAAPADPGAAAQALARKHNCLACHGLDSKLVGPSLREVARKYAGRADAADYLAQRIVSGGAGVWGAIPMPAQNLPSADARALAAWLAAGAR